MRGVYVDWGLARELGCGRGALEPDKIGERGKRTSRLLVVRLLEENTLANRVKGQ